jgi:hypothetical protein
MSGLRRCSPGWRCKAVISSADITAMTNLDDDAAARVMAWLGSGVPLSLLVDLLVPPCSAEVARVEGGDAAWWLRTSA